jgi:hypothetical protein
MAEAVDVTGTVVAVVEIAAGEAEAAAGADAISPVLPRPFLTAENLSFRRGALPPVQNRPGGRGSVQSRLAGFTLYLGIEGFPAAL